MFAFADKVHFSEQLNGMTLEYSENNGGKALDVVYGGLIAGLCMAALSVIISRCESDRVITAVRKEIKKAVNQWETKISQQIDDYHRQCMKNYVTPINPYYVSRHGAAWKDEYLNTFTVFHIFQKEREAQQCINTILAER